MIRRFVAPPLGILLAVCLGGCGASGPSTPDPGGTPATLASVTTPTTSSASGPGGEIGISADEAKSSGVYGAPGDGSVRVVSLTPTADAVVAVFRVTNVGTSSATYTLRVTAPEVPDFSDKAKSISLGGNDSVEVRISFHRPDPGRYELKAVLQSDLRKIDVSTDTAEFSITS